MEDSNVNLLSVETHTVDNNNMEKFLLYERTDNEKYVVKCTKKEMFVKKMPYRIYVAVGLSLSLVVFAVTGIIVRYTVFQKVEAAHGSPTITPTYFTMVPTESLGLWTSSVSSISSTSVSSAISSSSSFLTTSSVLSISSTSAISSISPSSSFLISSSVSSISSPSVISSISSSSSFSFMSSIMFSATVQPTLSYSESATWTPLTSISAFTISSSTSSITGSLFSASVDTLSTIYPYTTSMSTVVSTIIRGSLVPAVETLILLTPTVISSSVPVTSTIETVSTSTTIKPPDCEPGKYQCIDGMCIKELDVCNGIPDCATAEDESVNCSCSLAQYRCLSGQCVAKEHRCDSIPQCNDRSDEINCTGCIGFQCDSGQCLWRRAARCDRVFECLDLSDEMNCPVRGGLWRCNNSVLISNQNVCDGIDNCFDNSDEINCGLGYDGCPVQKTMCSDKTCILPEWNCDGYIDCLDRSDEMLCAYCTSGQFQCPDYSCILTSQICDGIQHCTSGTDETNCIILQLNGETSRDNGVLMLKSVDEFLPVCSDSWYPAIANNICQLLGHKGSSGAPSLISMAVTGVTDLQGFMVLDAGSANPTRNQSVLSQFTRTSTCSSKKVVQVSCQMNVCGKRQVDILIPMIVGGVLSERGKWPWIVSLSMLGEDICGGVIISPEWILTAAHCIVTPAANYSLTPHFFTITAGSIVRKYSNFSQTRHINRIILHPNNTRLETGVYDWDLALMHFSPRLEFGDYVQPICLPSQNEEFPSQALCFLAGWGFINPNSVSVDRLRETKMQLWQNDDCAFNVFNVESTVNVNSTLCAGYHSGLISACKGDSGSPLMCQNAWDHWTVVGIMSHGIDGCNGRQASSSNRFAKVSAATDWIQHVIQT